MECTLVQITQSDTHRDCKFGRLLKVLSSITDMSLYCKSLEIVNKCLYSLIDLICGFMFCIKQYTHNKILCNFKLFR